MVFFAPIRGSTLETFSVDNDQNDPSGHNGLVGHDSYSDFNDVRRFGAKPYQHTIFHLTLGITNGVFKPLFITNGVFVDSTVTFGDYGGGELPSIVGVHVADTHGTFDFTKNSPGSWTLTNHDTDVEYQGSGEFSPIPEPSTFTLICMGAVGLFGYVWRRRRRGA